MTISHDEVTALLWQDIGKAYQVIAHAYLTRAEQLAHNGASRELEPLEDGPATDRLVGVKAVARALGVSTTHVYRHREEYPFTRRMGRTIRFSARGLSDYVRSRPADDRAR